MLSRIFKGALAAGSLVNAVGSGIFTLNKFFDYVAKDSILRVPFSAFAALSGYAIQLTTRVPAMVKVTPDSNDPEIGLEENACCKYETDEEIKELSLKAASTYYSLLAIANISGGFSSLFAYLSSISFAEFVANLADVSLSDQPWKIYVIGGVGIYFAASNMKSYYVFNYDDTKIFAKKMAQSMDRNDFALDPVAAMKTFGVSFFNVASTPFLGYFGTMSSLRKLTFIPIPELGKQILSGISAFTYLTATLTTYVPSMYSYFTESAKVDGKIKQAFACQKPLKGIVYGFGFFDSVRTGIGNGMGVINTTTEIFKIDPYNPVLATCATLTACSTSLLNMAFSIRGGYQKTASLIAEKDPVENCNAYSDDAGQTTAIEIDTAYEEAISVDSSSEDDIPPLEKKATSLQM